MQGKSTLQIPGICRLPTW